METVSLLTPEQKSDILSNDVDALIALAQNRRADYSDILANLATLCLLYCGDADIRHDAVKRCAEELPGGSFVSLSGYDHRDVIFRRSDKLLAHIYAFLTGVS